MQELTNTLAHFPLNTQTQSYHYEHIRETKLAYLEIDKVITGTSLSTNMSPTTDRITLVKLWNKSKKYEHPCRVKHSNRESIGTCYAQLVIILVYNSVTMVIFVFIHKVILRSS